MFSGIAESILSSLCNVSYPQPDWMDLVVDTYLPYSIKNVERQHCSKGLGRRVKILTGSQKAPPDRNNYMSNEENKNELPDFLLSQWLKDSRNIEVLKKSILFLTHGEKMS